MVVKGRKEQEEEVDSGLKEGKCSRNEQDE